MRDPELQDAVESLLRSLSERTRCAVCYKIRSQGHTKSCRIGKLHALLNARARRLPLCPECGDEYDGFCLECERRRSAEKANERR